MTAFIVGKIARRETLLRGGAITRLTERLPARALLVRASGEPPLAAIGFGLMVFSTARSIFCTGLSLALKSFGHWLRTGRHFTLSGCARG